MKTIKISSFPNKDFKKFKKIKEYREKIINKTSPSVINNGFDVLTLFMLNNKADVSESF